MSDEEEESIKSSTTRSSLESLTTATDGGMEASEVSETSEATEATEDTRTFAVESLPASVSLSTLSTPVSTIRGGEDSASTLSLLSEDEALSTLHEHELSDEEQEQQEQPPTPAGEPSPTTNLPDAIKEAIRLGIIQPTDYLKICEAPEPCHMAHGMPHHMPQDPIASSDQYICPEKRICDPFGTGQQARRYGDLTKPVESFKDEEEDGDKNKEEKYEIKQNISLFEPNPSIEEEGFSETSSAELDEQLAEMCRLTERKKMANEEQIVSVPILPLTSELTRFEEKKKPFKDEPLYESSETASESPIPTLLQPDHPMMERFQRALRAHLLRQLDIVETETREMEGLRETRKRDCQSRGEQLSLSLMEKEKQHKAMESYRSTLEELNQLRQKTDQDIVQIRKRLELVTTQLKTEDNEVSELRAEQSKSHQLISNMRVWLEEMESQVKISRRVSSKTKTERARLAEEKRKQDLLLLRLEAERARLERESSQLDCQFRGKMHEREIAATTLAEAEADLQALRAEQRRLEVAWRSVAVTMSHRDKIYAKVQEELYETRERFKLIQIEEATGKKELVQVQSDHADLDELTSRLAFEIETQTFKINDLKKKVEHLSPKRNLLAQVIEQNEINLSLLDQEYQVIISQEKTMRREMDTLATYRIEMEKQIMRSLNERTTHDNVVKAQEKTLTILKEKTKEQELSLIMKENDFAKSILSLEQTRSLLERSRENLNETKKRMLVTQEETNKKRQELLNVQRGLGGKQLHLERLNKKLADLMQTTGKNQGLSASDIRIADLRASIEETSSSLEQYTKEWTRLQMFVVSLAEKRREQVELLDTTQKQVTLLEQKTHRYEMIVSEFKTKEAYLARNVTKKQQLLLMANSKLVEKRGAKETQDRQNAIVESEYTVVLKEASLEASKLEQSIEELEKKIIYRREDLDTMQRASLAWENKVKFAREAREAAKNDRKGVGELAGMRAEIHRMKCRLGQLHRVQEKLATDMEKGVARRDSIYDRAKAKEVRGGGDFSRAKFLRKMTQIESKVRTLHKEIKEIDIKIRNFRKSKQEMQDLIIHKQTEMGEIEAKTSLLQNRIQFAQLQKLLNLDQLVRRQRKSRRLMDARRGCRPLRWRTSPQIERQKELALQGLSGLVSVAELLLSDFPKGSQPRPYLERVHNLVRLPSS